MIKNRNTSFALFVAVFVILWNVLDLLRSALIAKTPYRFSVMADLWTPLLSAMALGYLLILRNGTDR